jgi:hypothetical protein
MTAALSILHGRTFALASAGETLPKLEAFAATQSMDLTKVIILGAINITAAHIKRRSLVLLAGALAFLCQPERQFESFSGPAAHSVLRTCS